MIDCLSHIIDYTVGNNQQNLEFLVLEVARISLANTVDGVQNRAEVGGTIQIDICQIMLVVLDDFLKVIDSRIEDVTVHSETVSGPLSIWGYTTTEAKQVDSLVSIVVLENSADLLNDLQVLITLHVEVMK